MEKEYRTKAFGIFQIALNWSVYEFDFHENNHVKPWPNGYASSRKLNWRTDLCWLSKRTSKSAGKCTQVVKKKNI